MPRLLDVLFLWLCLLKLTVLVQVQVQVPAVAALEAASLLGMRPSSQTAMNGHAQFRLGYVTDVEGNLDYFLRHVVQSKVLRIQHSSQQSLRLDLQDPCCYFVYGGDAVDKGPGDIRLVRALVDLKKRHPDRVYLLVGNRDLNKLRFTAELADDDMDRPVADIPPPHWDPQAPSLKEYLQTKLEQQLRDATCTGTAHHSNSTALLEQLNTRVHRLHYMLEHTLGCPQTFSFRRQELALLQNVPEASISDDEVVRSFLDQVQHPHGALWQYLECAHVAVVLGNTLFCHGAVDVHTMQYVPRHDTKFENPIRKPPAGAMMTDVHEWTRALNRYLQVGLEDYRRRPFWNAHRTSRGGEALLALQNRPAMWGRSIVSNAYGDGGCITTDHATQDRRRVVMDNTENNNNPLAFEKVCSDPLDPTVAEWLLSHGIQRVVVGHKPTGDCPAVLSAAYTGVEVVSADTSFSDTTSHDNRGQAVAVVELVGASPTDNQLELRGSLRDGQTYVSRFLRLHPGGVDASVGDANLGREIQTSAQQKKWWVKVATDKSYWLTSGKGRHVEYKEVAKDSLLAESKV
jgi:hypothetical protein